MKENQTNYCFNEWWSKEMRDFAYAKSHSIVEDFTPENQTIYVRSSNIYELRKKEPAPLFMMEWAETHPFPNCSMMEFVYQLGLRVAILETKLARKGGAL